MQIQLLNAERNLVDLRARVAVLPEAVNRQSAEDRERAIELRKKTIEFTALEQEVTAARDAFRLYERKQEEARISEALDRSGLDRRRLAAGDRLRLDDAVVDIRSPPRGSVPAEPPDTGTGINNVSAVLDLRFGARRLLLTGDIEEGIDPQLLAAGIASGGRLDLLKVAHHGSRTATTEAFLAALRPRVAVVSAGDDNPYGHPTRQALDRPANLDRGKFYRSYPYRRHPGWA